MIVCRYCLEAIESHEGKQMKKEIECDDIRLDDNGQHVCEWCEELTEYDELIEIF